MRFWVWLFLSPAAFASSIPECPKTSQAKVDIAETAFYEWRLIEEVLLKEQTRLQLLNSEGFSYELAEAKERVKRFESLVIAKNAIALAEAKALPEFESKWTQEIRGRLISILRGNSRPSYKQFCEQETQAFLENYHHGKKAVAIRWESLRLAFGHAPVNKFILHHLGFQRLVDNNQKQKNPARILYLYEGKPSLKIDNSLIYQSSAFDDRRAKAEELQTFLLKNASKAEPLVIITEGNNASIMNTLLDHYPSFRTEGSISAWVIVNGSILGNEPALKMISNSQLKRTIASGSPRARAEYQSVLDHQKARTEIPLSPGMGFPIINIVDEGRIESDDFDVSFSAPEDSKNILIKKDSMRFEVIDTLLAELKQKK
jgi:hypothetical protein